LWRNPEIAAKALGFFVPRKIGLLFEPYKTCVVQAPEQEQSGAEPFFFGKKEDEFSVDSVPEEEGIERERCENKNLRGC
jgi:hypothetical protein